MTRPACLKVLRCWEIAPCVTPLPRVSSATLISFDRTIRSYTERRVGSASARITRSTEAVWSMRRKLACANGLVNANIKHSPRIGQAALEPLEAGDVRDPFARHLPQPGQSRAVADEAAHRPEAQVDEGWRADRHAHRLHRADGAIARSALRYP